MFKRIAWALVTAGALIAAGSTAASAHTVTHRDTPACNSTCVSLFGADLGPSVDLNAYVKGDDGIGGKVGTRVNLHLTANFRPNGDWEPDITGFVAEYCGFYAGDLFSPTSYVCTHYASFAVIEMDWAPFGNESGLCAGVASAVNGASVTLQPCGVSAKTVWIADRDHASQGGNCLNAAPLPVGPATNYCPFINGGDTAFSHPLVLALNTGTSKPQNALQLATENLVGGEIRSNEAFAFYNG